MGGSFPTLQTVRAAIEALPEKVKFSRGSAQECPLGKVSGFSVGTHIYWSERDLKLPVTLLPRWAQLFVAAFDALPATRRDGSATKDDAILCLDEVEAFMNSPVAEADRATG